MIAEFENQLATVLGARLPTPFKGQVSVPPRAGGQNGLAILVGVREAKSVVAKFASSRPEALPGLDDPRRIVAMSCTVEVQILAGATMERSGQLAALDAVLYTLDAGDFRDGHALNTGNDSGFHIHEMRWLSGQIPLEPSAANAAPVGLLFGVDGWFWPVNTPGQGGIKIGEIRIRNAVLPIELSPLRAAFVASEPPVAMSLRVGGTGSQLSDHPAVLPFDRLAVAIVGPGGKPGAGTVSGGTAGAAGVQLLNLTADNAQFTYTVPAATASDTLIVALDDGADGLGIEIGRFELRTREA